MKWSWGLFLAAGLVSFFGFLLVALGTASDIPVQTPLGFGSAFLNRLIPWGIGFIGLGVMLGLFGAAVKGPSVEWKDITPGSSGLRTVEFVALVIIGVLVAIGLAIAIWLL